MIPPHLSVLDAHAHLCDAAFDADRAEVLERARNAGVLGIVAVGESLADARRNLQLADEYPMIRPAAGLYPTHLDPAQAAEMETFIRAQRNRLVAIGEVGLDYWAVKEDEAREIQRTIFAGFVTLARELDLPLNVHSRSAGRHAVRLLLDLGAARVQLHAFDGNAGSALPAVEAGFFFSIPPSIVRSEQKQKLVTRLPLACLLVESDSPVLGPIPMTRNEPANIVRAVQEIARLKNTREEAVLEMIRENELRLGVHRSCADL
jgi:TatD DNase family protein